MDGNYDALGQGLIYEDMLPLRWCVLDIAHTPLELMRLQESNEEVLRIISVLDEHLSDGVEEHAPLNQEMLRIETKLNLLLALVGQLFMLHYPQPPARPVKVTPTYVEWIACEHTQLGEYGMVELYLSPRCPRPLLFAGMVSKVDPLPGGHCIHVEFSDLTESTKERLEKIIFRHHRRRIALARRRLPDPIG